ncbi:MAG TPA: MerR family transcriptional regulator [Sedimenticola thiotaurini]|uniref:MerR family transcriptional regulator n=1 Tax=Sedimenticola thiotaurini TaxID=1543721 RepID=A0A831RMG3_9GAMM|nr:MerR family transcriptional regulator [Sedimenticola thiotaurini]
MTHRELQEILSGHILEEEVQLTLGELSRSCAVQAVHIMELVEEGILEPRGGRDPLEWRFSGDSLRRARTALRLQQDLDVNLSGAALIIDLLDQVEQLRRQLRLLQRC